ncbi:hypothetical protein GCM10010472_11100 [Pseudonocardia halophobica]|uniref:Uncharacterized protein n=1 Tax=Pseudonocardia halophobica TaxID=29401 RepID=A0A9W6NYH5_9PSEU|nr:hypothetical protein [Pseudonocardia halophobica]GLL13497.1 hypothetical protein GCM10017577_46410 [Pseudonocardia halophobica]
MPKHRIARTIAVNVGRRAAQLLSVGAITYGILALVRATEADQLLAAAYTWMGASFVLIGLLGLVLTFPRRTSRDRAAHAELVRERDYWRNAYTTERVRRLADERDQAAGDTALRANYAR